MKLPLRMKETLYYDSDTGKPVGSEYWIFDDAAEELFVINDDEEAARYIIAAVNACEGIKAENLEKGIIAQMGEEWDRNYPKELDRLRQQNARLLEALKEVLPIVKHFIKNHEFVTIEKMEAAIAAAESAELAESEANAHAGYAANQADAEKNIVEKSLLFRE